MQLPFMSKQNQELLNSLTKNNVMTKIMETESTQNSSEIQKVMQSLGLNSEEIEIYIKSSGSGPISVGEMAISSNISVENCQKTVNRFVQMGLFKEIIGPKHYYQALPPYVAIIRQLDNFGEYIRKLQEDIPHDLMISYKRLENEAKSIDELDSFKNYFSNLRQDMNGKLTERRQALTDMEQQSKSLIEAQFDALNAQVVQSLTDFDNSFVDTSKALDQSVEELYKEIEQIITHLDALPGKIASEKKIFQSKKSLEEAVQIVVDPEITLIKAQFQTQFKPLLLALVDNLKFTFREQLNLPLRSILEKSRDSFKIDFEVPFQRLLDTVATKFSSILAEFDTTLNELQSKMTKVSEGVNHAFEGLRKTFSERVVNSLTDTMGKISERLNSSSMTVKEFWDESKRAIQFSMKDVWFIHSAEGMRAQLKDSISRIKMRLLLVAPNLLDIDLEPILALPRHINIRIVCLIDPSNLEHQKILEKILSHSNIAIRQRELQNLWGINRDYEEAIVGIVSAGKNIQAKIDGESKSNYLEIAGIGSNFQEHIQMLVPILEEAWMNSKKPEIAGAPEIKTPYSEIVVKSNESIIDTNKDSMESAPFPSTKVYMIQEENIQYTFSILSKAFDDLTISIAKGQLYLCMIILYHIKSKMFESQGHSKLIHEMETWIARLSPGKSIDDRSLKILEANISIWKQKA